jgi:hypothetical protein
MIRPTFAPVPTEIDAVSPAALIDTVAVEPANAQVVVAAAGGGAASAARQKLIRIPPSVSS